MSKLDLISPEVRERMAVVLSRYPEDKQRSAVVEMLLLLQKQNGGSLTQDLMEAAAEFLSLPPIQVYEIATFYDMYELNLIGKHKIAICTNVSCMLAGSGEIVKRFEEKCGTKLGETSADGCFTLREVECLADCVNAPVCQINNESYVEKLTVEKVDAMVEEMRGDA